MKALLCKKFGPVSELSWEETADPVAGPNEIVIDVKAAGLNYPDNLIVQGLYQLWYYRTFFHTLYQWHYLKKNHQILYHKFQYQKHRILVEIL